MTQELGIVRDGWTLTEWSEDLRGLVTLTIEKDGLVERFEQCHFGPNDDAAGWAVAQAERRARVRAMVSEQEVSDGADR